MKRDIDMKCCQDGAQPGLHARPSRRQAIVGGAAVIAAASLAAGCAKPAQRRSAFSADRDAISPTDPALVKYRERTVIKAGVRSPFGIAVGSDGTLWIAGTNAVEPHGIGGEKADGRAVAGFEGAAACVAVGARALYVGIGAHVLELPLDGSPGRPWPSLGEKSVITCIAVGEADIYVADAGIRRIVRYSADGKALGYLCEKDETRGYSGLIVPSPHLDVAVDADGAVHVANPGQHLIEIYEPDGSPRWSWGETSQEMPGFCGCCNPTDFAILPDGRYVTAEKGIPRIKVYGKTGHFEAVVAGPEHLSPGVVGLDVATMPDGTVLALDRVLGGVRVFEPKGEA